MKLESVFTMEFGRVVYPDPEKFRRAIQSLPDGIYINRIEKLYSKRTNPQNSYYWGVVLPLVKDGLLQVGYECHSLDEAHEFCKNQFIIIQGRKRKRLVNRETGEVRYVKVFPSTRKLTTVEFSEYIDRIIRWSAEYLGVIIPYPGEILEEKEEIQYQDYQP